MGPYAKGAFEKHGLNVIDTYNNKNQEKFYL